MRLSKKLEEAVFIHSDDDLLGVLSEDVIHDMRAGSFTAETVEEALTGIFASYVLTEEDAPLVDEAIEELGVSMGLTEGFMDWLKSAAKSALKAVGQAALGAAKEGGKQAIATSAAELKKRIKAKEKKEPPEPPQPKGAEEEEPEEKPKKKAPKKKAPKKTREPEEEPEEEPKEKAPKKSKKKAPKKSKEPEEEPKEKAPKKPKAPEKPEPKEGDKEEPEDIKQNLKDIASKALGKIADDPAQAKEILKKHGKKAVKAIAKHGVKKGMKMVFGRWIKAKGGSKKEWTTTGSLAGSPEMDKAVRWLMAESEVSTLADGTTVYDFEGAPPDWVCEAFQFGGVSPRFTWSDETRRLSFNPEDDGAQFMMTEAKRIPKRVVSKWPLKQIRSYAYEVLERESMSDDSRISDKADVAFTKFLENKMSRKEMEWWAEREVEFRELHQ